MLKDSFASLHSDEVWSYSNVSKIITATGWTAVDTPLAYMSFSLPSSSSLGIEQFFGDWQAKMPCYFFSNIVRHVQAIFYEQGIMAVQL